MERGDPAAQDEAKTHGLMDAINPGQADPIICVVKVQAEKEAGEVVLVEI